MAWAIMEFQYGLDRIGIPLLPRLYPITVSAIMEFYMQKHVNYYKVLQVEGEEM